MSEAPDGSPEARSSDVSVTDGLFRVSARVVEMGADCVVLLWGGTRPHVGAIGIAQWHPGPRDHGVPSTTSSVFTLPGHKEDAVAKAMSLDLARRLGRNTVVVAGMHWDDLDERGIVDVTALCERITRDIAARLSVADGGEPGAGG
jgi:hypothetical protein